MAKHHYAESASLSEKERFKKYLAEDEELVMAVGVSLAYLSQVAAMAMVFPGVLLMLLAVLIAYFDKIDIAYGLLVGLFLAITVGIVRAIIFHHGRRYLLTTRRVVLKKGFFMVDLTSALYDKITHIEVIQSFVDRFLLHHGKVIINTAGMSKNEIVLPYIDHPIEFKNILERLINREREHFGRSGGAVSTIEGEIVD